MPSEELKMKQTDKYSYTPFDMAMSNVYIPKHGDASNCFASLVSILASQGQTLSGAESCTGGLVAKLITDISGASSIFCGGVVSYTNDVKIQMLGVAHDSIEKYTEVSCQVAYEMASGIKQRTGSNIAYSTTGYAGPGGGTEQEPVGTVYVAIVTDDKNLVFRLSFSSEYTREQIRLGTAGFVASKILEIFD